MSKLQWLFLLFLETVIILCIIPIIRSFTDSVVTLYTTIILASLAYGIPVLIYLKKFKLNEQAIKSQKSILKKIFRKVLVTIIVISFSISVLAGTGFIGYYFYERHQDNKKEYFNNFINNPEWVNSGNIEVFPGSFECTKAFGDWISVDKINYRVINNSKYPISYLKMKVKLIKKGKNAEEEILAETDVFTLQYIPAESNIELFDNSIGIFDIQKPDHLYMEVTEMSILDAYVRDRSMKQLRALVESDSSIQNYEKILLKMFGDSLLTPTGVPKYQNEPIRE